MKLLIARSLVYPFCGTRFFMNTKQHVGNFGEDIAALFLRRKGYRLLTRNYFLFKVGEIDLIMRDKKGVLVFVEVKTLGGESEHFSPEQHFNDGKQFRVRRLAQAFCNKHPEYVDGKLGFRIDLVAVTLRNPVFALKDYSENCTVNHYENAC